MWILLNTAIPILPCVNSLQKAQQHFLSINSSKEFSTLLQSIHWMVGNSNKKKPSRDEDMRPMKAFIQYIQLSHKCVIYIDHTSATQASHPSLSYFETVKSRRQYLSTE